MAWMGSASTGGGGAAVRVGVAPVNEGTPGWWPREEAPAPLATLLPSDGEPARRDSELRALLARDDATDWALR
jgi:hypothetical protein